MSDINKYTFCKEIKCSGLLNNKCIASKCNHPEKKIYDFPADKESAQILSQRLNKKHRKILKDYSTSLSGQNTIMSIVKEVNNDIVTLDKAINDLGGFCTLKIFGLVNEIPSQKILDEIIG